MDNRDIYRTMGDTYITVDHVVNVFRSHMPPKCKLYVSIHNPNSLQIHVHGIHGCGKTTTSKMILQDLPGFAYIDENYEAIHNTVIQGGDVTHNLCKLLADRKLPRACLVDRSPIDAIIYEVAEYMANSPVKDASAFYRCLPITYSEYMDNHSKQNHIWMEPDDISICRANVIRRGRLWDASTDDPFYGILAMAYKHIARCT